MNVEQLKAENEALRAMFQTDGWKVLIRNTEEKMEAFRKGMPHNIPDEKSLFYAKGLLAALDTIVQMPEYLDQLEEAMAQEDAPA